MGNMNMPLLVTMGTSGELRLTPLALLIAW